MSRTSRTDQFAALLMLALQLLGTSGLSLAHAWDEAGGRTALDADRAPAVAPLPAIGCSEAKPASDVEAGHLHSDCELCRLLRTPSQVGAQPYPGGTCSRDSRAGLHSLDVPPQHARTAAGARAPPTLG
jgi:hypothetical protein